MKNFIVKSMMAGSLLAMSFIASAGTLVLNSNQSDPVPKAAFAEIIKQFEKENPDIKVKQTIFDHEAYKTALRNWLTTSPPDVVHWYAGNRMKQFVSRNLFEDVSDIWQEEKLDTHMASSLAAMTINEKQWGVPFSYYQWGVYYRKDLFKKFSIKEPKTWKEFLAACEGLKKNGIAPIAIGTKYLWTAAGWFDHLNLRINGLAFHLDLMDGKIPYTDPRVKEVFNTWKQLVEPDYFLANHATYSWQEGHSFMLNGKAGMYLLGNFITHNFGDKKNLMGFFPFPQINPKVARSEDAPMDTIHIPAKAKNKKDARRFLTFMARADVQSKLNSKIGQIPPHAQATTTSNYFLDKGVEMLKTSAGTAQFYDRDTSPAMAKEGMKGFQEFMVKPERLEKILKRLERARKREFGRRS